MPYSDEIDRKLRLVKTRIWGRITFEEALDHHENLRKRPDFDPTFNQLIDATDLLEARINADQARAMGERPLFSSKSKRVLVTVNAATFGVGRMMLSYREMAGSQESMLITRDMKMALAFLGINASSPETS